MSLLSEAKAAWAIVAAIGAAIGATVFAILILMAALNPTPENVGAAVSYGVEDALSGILLIAKLAAIPLVGGLAAAGYIIYVFAAKGGRF